MDVDGRENLGGSKSQGKNYGITQRTRRVPTQLSESEKDDFEQKERASMQTTGDTSGGGRWCGKRKPITKKTASDWSRPRNVRPLADATHIPTPENATIETDRRNRRAFTGPSYKTGQKPKKEKIPISRRVFKKARS